MLIWASWVLLVIKNLPANAEDARDVGSIPEEDLLEEEMATCSSVLAWKIPWTEKAGRLQFIESQKVGRE